MRKIYRVFIVFLLVISFSASFIFITQDNIGTASSCQWSSMSGVVSGGTDNQINCIFGLSSSNVFCVGGGGTIAHYDGSVWQQNNFGTTFQLLGIWGSSSSNVYAVGADIDNGSWGEILHYNGSSWAVDLDTVRMTSIWGTSASNIFAVGRTGTILHFDGSSWTQMPSPTTNWIESVYGSSSSNVFAVGWYNTILHYNGIGWEEMSNSNPSNFFGVWSSSPSDAFAVGAGGIIVHYNGGTWNLMNSGVTGTLCGVWGTSSTNVYAVGENGTILHYDGNPSGIWTQIDSCTSTWLRSVWGSSSTDIFVVGRNSLILHYSGTSTPTSTPTPTPMSTPTPTPTPTSTPPHTPISSVALTLFVRSGSTSGPIITGASVTGNDGDGDGFSQTTNADGYVTITGTPGTWLFYVSKDGYQTKSWSQSTTATVTRTAYLIANTPTPGVTPTPTPTSTPTATPAQEPGSFTLNGEAYWNTKAPAGPAIMLTWTSSSGATCYDLYKDGSLSIARTCISGTSFDNNVGITVGQTYRYYAVARNSGGTTQSNTISITVPSSVVPATPTVTPIASFSVSNPSPPYYLNPVFDEDIIFNASGSQPSLDATKIVNYHWDFGDGSTHIDTEYPEIIHAYQDDSMGYYKSERSCKITLTVTDDKGRSASTSLDLIIKRPPVLLVHGFQIGIPFGFDVDDTWKTMAEYLTGGNIENAPYFCPGSLNLDTDFCMRWLEGNGFTVYLSCYTHETSVGTAGDIRWYAKSLSQEIQSIKIQENVSKVDIVAHSMGGLVSRTYIENADLINNPNAVEYQHDVRKLIMLGTPNHGAYIAEMFDHLVPGLAQWDSVRQIKGDTSELLSPLNSGVTGGSEGVEYSAIAGNLFDCQHPSLYCRLHQLDIMCQRGALVCSLTSDYNDGLINVNSVMLDNLRWFKKYQLNHGQLAYTTGPVVQYMLDMSTMVDTEPIQIPNLNTGQLCSPGELRVYDFQGRVTGLVNGEIVEEIPGSTYDNETNAIIIFAEGDSFYWEVVGTDDGIYGLDITNDSNGEVTSFVLTNFSTTNGAIHNYTVDWITTAQGGNGVTLCMDSDGDGNFEETQHLSATGENESSENGTPYWVWVAVGGLSVFAVLFAAIIYRVKFKPVKAVNRKK